MADSAIKKLHDIYGITVYNRAYSTPKKKSGTGNQHSRAVAIDGTKLKALIKKSTGSCKAASRQMGYSENFISVCCCTGFIQPSAIRLIEHEFGIKLEDYKAQEKPKAYIKQSDPEQKDDIQKSIDAIAKGLGEFEKIVNSNMFQIFKRLEQHGIYCEEILQLEKQNNAMMAKLLKELE